LCFCSLIGKKHTSELIFPTFLELLKDEQIPVQLTIFSSINEICDVLGVETLTQNTLPAICELAQHAQWRIRSTSIELLFYMIRKSGRDFMNEKAIKQVMDYLRDRVNAVRKEGVRMLSKIQLEFGTEWLERNLMPRVVQISKAESYLNREVFLEAVEALCPNLSPECMAKHINPILHGSYLQDGVENVRLVLCRTLRTVFDRCPKDREVVRKSLRVLAEDRSKDVKELANKLLK
jgi:hypothetical protein